ncbi:hypothetical protein ACKKBF_B03295 [Auxenochlorella protothecoides x Auxenochlorella symbiontica]
MGKTSTRKPYQLCRLPDTSSGPGGPTASFRRTSRTLVRVAEPIAALAGISADPAASSRPDASGRNQTPVGPSSSRAVPAPGPPIIPARNISNPILKRVGKFKLASAPVLDARPVQAVGHVRRPDAAPPKGQASPPPGGARNQLTWRRTVPKTPEAPRALALRARLQKLKWRREEGATPPQRCHSLKWRRTSGALSPALPVAGAPAESGPATPLPSTQPTSEPPAARRRAFLALRMTPRRLPTTRSARRAVQQRTPVYCPEYCRTGSCPRRGRGCSLRHDPTKRAVCARWLAGSCPLGPTCPLQHQRVAELMPLCIHFIKGSCANGNCPYLHVKLVATAPVCARFLKGYCPAGARCPHRHLTLRMLREERRLTAPLQFKKRQRDERAKRGLRDADFLQLMGADGCSAGSAGPPQDKSQELALEDVAGPADDADYIAL